MQCFSPLDNSFIDQSPSGYIHCSHNNIGVYRDRIIHSFYTQWQIESILPFRRIPHECDEIQYWWLMNKPLVVMSLVSGTLAIDELEHDPQVDIGMTSGSDIEQSNDRIRIFFRDGWLAM